MMTPAEILTLVTATGKAVDIFDKISGQIKSVLLRRKKEPEADDQRWRHKITAEKGTLVVRSDSRVIQTITATDIEKLPSDYLALIKTYEKKMEQRYRIWQKIYAQKDTSPDPRVNAQVDEQLRDEVVGMSTELTGIIDFLGKLGLSLDDHYMHVRHLVEDAGRN